MSLRARLLVTFLVPALIVLGLGGWLLFRASRAVLEEELGDALSRVAASVASELKADRVLSLTPEDAQGEGSRTFRALSAQLNEVKSRTQVRRVLVFDAQRRARLDLGGVLPPLAEVPELLRDSGELDLVFRGQRASSQVLFEGTDGQLYKTGYAPILSDGQVVAAVAIEGSAAFFGPLTGLRNAFLSLAGLMLALLTVAAVVSAAAVQRPLDRLVASALRIGQGDLSTPVPPEGQWEVGILARELEAMRTSLESRDRQLKLMLGGVAHEVKNPLGGMKLFVGLLEEELRSPTLDVSEARAHLEKVSRELSYLERIVEDFLGFAREQRLNVAPLDVGPWLAAAAHHLAGEAGARQVRIEVEAADLRLTADESLLTSALVNLIKNAVQVSLAQQLVRVRAKLEGPRCVVEVEDQGAGIPVEAQARIFEPFFTTREKGTGLGLPLARKIAEAHRGTLTVTSRPGQTIFRLELPVG